MVAELELPEIIGQAHLTKRGSILVRALEAKDSVIFVGPWSAGKTTMLMQVGSQLGAVRVNGGKMTATELRGALMRLPAYGKVITLDKVPTGAASKQLLLDFIGDGGQVLAETDDVLKIDPALRDKFTVIRLARPAPEDLERVIEANGNGHIWSGEALQLASQASFTSVRHAARIGRLAAGTAETNEVTEADVKRVLDTIDPEEGLRGSASEIISCWIKEMRLGRVEEALYWARAGLEAGVTPSYFARRFLIFAFEDALDPNATIAATGAAQLAVHAPRDIEAVYTATFAMCKATKFWETEEGRDLERINQKLAIEQTAGGMKPPKMRPFTRFGVDRHTTAGRADFRRGKELDERFTGHRPGRLHMVEYYAHHGRLDIDERCDECEGKSLKNERYLQQLGNPMQRY